MTMTNPLPGAEMQKRIKRPLMRLVRFSQGVLARQSQAPFPTNPTRPGVDFNQRGTSNTLIHNSKMVATIYQNSSHELLNRYQQDTEEDTRQAPEQYREATPLVSYW